MADQYNVKIIEQPIRATIQGGAPGAPGPPGPPGGSAFTVTAGEGLSMGRCVVMDGDEAFYYQPGDPTHGGRLYGVTTSAAGLGGSVTIQITGQVEDVSFAGFSDEVLWVGTDGILQTAQPGAGNLQKAAVAIGSNRIRIDFSIQITQI